MSDTPDTDENRAYEARYGLATQDIEVLALYKSERDRGIVHTADWVAQMDYFQSRFNEHQSRQPLIRYYAPRRWWKTS